MPEPCKFLFLDSCLRRFLWTHKEVDLAPHPGIGLELQVGDVEKFPKAPGFSKQGPCFTTIVGDGGDERLAELELSCKDEGVAPPDPVQAGHCCYC